MQKDEEEEEEEEEEEREDCRRPKERRSTDASSPRKGKDRERAEGLRGEGRYERATENAWRGKGEKEGSGAECAEGGPGQGHLS